MSGAVPHTRAATHQLCPGRAQPPSITSPACGTVGKFTEIEIQLQTPEQNRSKEEPPAAATSDFPAPLLQLRCAGQAQERRLQVEGP